MKAKQIFSESHSDNKDDIDSFSERSNLDFETAEGFEDIEDIESESQDSSLPENGILTPPNEDELSSALNFQKVCLTLSPILPSTQLGVFG